MSLRWTLFILLYFPMFLGIIGMSVVAYVYLIPSKKVIFLMVLMAIPLVSYVGIFFAAEKIIKSSKEKDMYEVNKTNIRTKYIVIILEGLLLASSLYFLDIIAIVIFVIAYSVIITNLCYISNEYSGLEYNG